MGDRKTLMQEGWERSIPVKPGGLSASYGVTVNMGAWKEIAAYDDQVRIMLDLGRVDAHGERKPVVVVWRIWRENGRPIAQFDSPFGLAVDRRLMAMLAECDHRSIMRTNQGMRELVAELDAENAKLAKERWAETWGKVDHSLAAYYMRRVQAHGGKVVPPRSYDLIVFAQAAPPAAPAEGCSGGAQC